jgi:hypothetical protein
MGMGQEKGLNLPWIKTPLLPVAAFHLLAALKKPAVHKYLLALRRFHEVAGSSNRPYSAKTRNPNHIKLLLLVGLRAESKASIL